MLSVLVCVELGDWESEKLSGRVKLEDHSPKWRALRNVSFQPCTRLIVRKNLWKNSVE